jgi:hypothetical protein
MLKNKIKPQTVEFSMIIKLYYDKIEECKQNYFVSGAIFAHLDNSVFTKTQLRNVRR